MKRATLGCVQFVGQAGQFLLAPTELSIFLSSWNGGHLQWVKRYRNVIRKAFCDLESVQIYVHQHYVTSQLYLFFTSISSFQENLSCLFPRHLPVVKISPEWVTSPEQGKSSCRIATFSLWTGMCRDGISSISGETVILLWLGRHFLVCENRV